MYYGSFSRRRFLAASAAATAALVTGCSLQSVASPTVDDRLKSRPGTPTRSAPIGIQALGLSAGRDGLLYVPASAQTSHNNPLLVLLHGAGGKASSWFGSYGARSDASGIVILAVESRGRTWHSSISGAGADGAFIDRALAEVFDKVSIDPKRIALGGFSDGASFSLSLGLTNGDYFHNVIAYSPGYLEARPPHGKPPIFISHGTNDNILSIDQTSRQFVPLLRQAGYTIDYREFVGVHEVPAEISDAAIAWVMASWRTKNLLHMAS
jgi:predicted esterase